MGGGGPQHPQRLDRPRGGRQLWPIYELAVLAAGAFLLIIPGIAWLGSQTTEAGMKLFNRACFYPLAVFGTVAVLTLI